MLGLVMTALTAPGTADLRIAAQPPGASEWSLPALGLGAIATSFLEPDPEFTWDAARAAAIRDALTSPPDLGMEPPGDERSTDKRRLMN
jgi:hypothetical protein